jgi:hypothetical protein
MNKHIFASGALYETIALSPVEPLHCTLLSHKKLLSPERIEFILPALVEALAAESTPSSAWKNRLRYRVRAEFRPREKAPAPQAAWRNYGTKLGSPMTMARISTAKHRNVNPKLARLAAV